MSVKIQRREVTGVVILDLSGRITIGEASVAVRNAVHEEIGKNLNKILLNLAEVNYIDSAGLGELIAAYTTVKNRGGELKLLNLTDRVQGLMQITKLYTVFDVYDNEATALDAFGA